MKKAPSETWITGAVLMTQNSARLALKANLRIVNGRIDAITSRSPSKSAKKVIDAAGLTLIPGFVQAHVHLCQTLFRNQADDLELMDWLAKRIWVMEAAHTYKTLHTSALWGIHELLTSGTTCILDMGTVRHTEAIFEAVRKTGIRASVGKCLMDNPDTTPSTLRDTTDHAINEARALYDRWHGRENDRIRVSYAPRFVVSCTDKLLREVARTAQEQKALVHTHASENQKEIELVRKLVGRENVEYLDALGLTSSRLVLAHCIWLNEKEKEILRLSGTHVVHCPSSNLKLASGIAPIPELRSRGINVALGADGAPCNNNLDMFGEMRLAALIHKPGSGPRTLRAGEALDMATLGGAKALNWSDDIGSIEIGKKADIAALDLGRVSNSISAGDELNPETIASSIVYASRGSDVAFTMVDGKMVARSGKARAIPREALMRDVRKAQRAIRSFTGAGRSTENP